MLKKFCYKLDASTIGLNSLLTGSGGLIAGSLESANWSILAARRLFKEVVGTKNQDFMLIRF